MEGFSSPVASGAFTPIINADDGGSSSDSEHINELAQAMSTVHIRRRGRYESDMQRTPQSAIRPRKRIDVSEGMDEGKDEDKENAPAEPALDEDKHVTPPKATPSRLDRITQLREELTCSVCLEICTRPCTTPCGHSFCRSCLRASLAHSSKCAKCREALPQATMEPCSSCFNIFAIQLWQNLGLVPNLCNHAPNRVQQQQRTASQAVQLGNGAAAGDYTDRNTRSNSTGGRGSRLTELLDQVEGGSEEEFQGSSNQERASSRGRPASAQAPLRHPLQHSVQVTQQAEANQGGGLSRRLATSQRQQQQQQRPRQRLPGAPRLHLVSAQRDHPQEQEQEQRLQQRQRWQHWQQLQQGGNNQAAAGTARTAAPAEAVARASEHEAVARTSVDEAVARTLADEAVMRASTDEAVARASADGAVAGLQLGFFGPRSGHPGLVTSTAQVSEVAESAAVQGHHPDPAAPDPDTRAPASSNPFVRQTHHTVQPQGASAVPRTSAGSHSDMALPAPPVASAQPQLHQQHHPLSQRLFRHLLQPPPSPESPPYAADPWRFSSGPMHTVAAGSGDSVSRGDHAPCLPQLCRQRRRVQHGDEEFVGREEGMEAVHCDGVDGMGGEIGHANSLESDDAGGLASALHEGHTSGGMGVACALGSRLGGAVEHNMWPAPPGSRSNPIEILTDSDGEQEELGCPAEDAQDLRGVQQQAAAAAAAEPPPQAQGAPHELADQVSLGLGRVTHAHVQQQEGGSQQGSSDGQAPARPASVSHNQQVSLHPWVVPGIRRSNSSGSTRGVTGNASASLRPMGVPRSTLARSTLLAGCSGAASVPGLRRPRPRNRD
ncbi:hypothetical protein DUNSADRAFT_12888 [Dunaliella salina]|uniref:RING-type domain-containing protein n=1 Tax=Dunaliella salina TaxID=3046 RepID=A0ABQ7H3K0_DUNSA|nr:hypothetical protein DUNSADRAFT_12888 [Dunaliella salina]|eukprot:KAF5841444.1 hypothetical protein DUNSADRAFT_12888 [Dunaliella salina]